MKIIENSTGIRMQGKVHLLGRALYHGFVGAFLGLIPVFGIQVADKFASPHRGDMLLSLWAIFTFAYTYVRVQRERRIQMRWPEPALWGGLWSQLPHAFIAGGVLGTCVSILFFHFHMAFFVGGGLLAIAVVALGYSSLLAGQKSAIGDERQVISAWVTAGPDEAERTRRAAYARSKALLIGAAAAGVAEYDGAPRLTWPAPPSGDWQFLEAGAPAVINPASGMPMPGDGTGGIDMGGNLWGHNGDD